MSDSWKDYDFNHCFPLENLTDSELLSRIGSLDFPNSLSMELNEENLTLHNKIVENEIEEEIMQAMDENSTHDGSGNNNHLLMTPDKTENDCACNNKFKIICKQQDGQIASFIRALEESQHDAKCLKNELQITRNEYDKVIESLKNAHMEDIAEMQKQHEMNKYIGQKQYNMVMALNKQFQERDEKNKECIVIIDTAFKKLRSRYNISETDQEQIISTLNEKIIEISDDEDEMDNEEENCVFLFDLKISKDMYERLAVFAMTNEDIFVKESLKKIIGENVVYMSANGFIRGIPRPKIAEHVKGSIYKIYRDVVINFKMSYIDLDSKINKQIEKLVIKRGFSLYLSPEEETMALNRLDELKPISN